MSETLEDRIAKLEKRQDGGVRFFLQYLASPIAVLAMGGFFTWMLDEERREFEQLEVAEKMLPTLFSEEEHRALATKRLLDELLSDEVLKSSLDEIVQDYYKSKISNAVEEGDVGAAAGVYNAASAIGGRSGNEIQRAVDTNPVTKEAVSKYQAARPHEIAALEAIADNQFEVALEEIRKAEEIYPALHSVREIRQLLDNNRSRLSDPATQDEVRSQVVEKYSWKVPENTLDRMRVRP